MARPLPYLELALALQEGDKANDFTRALWDNSALFDLTEQDEEGNYISPHDDDLREELSGESFEAVAQRITLSWQCENLGSCPFVHDQQYSDKPLCNLCFASGKLRNPKGLLEQDEYL